MDRIKLALPRFPTRSFKKNQFGKKGKFVLNKIPNPITAFEDANSILRRWLTYYRCSNAGKTFSYIKYQIFHQCRRYLEFYLSSSNSLLKSSAFNKLIRKPKYKNKDNQTRTDDRKKLNIALSEKYLHQLPGFFYFNKKRKQKWWCIPEKKSTWLVFPADYSIRSPRITENKSSYHPKDKHIL